MHAGIETGLMLGTVVLCSGCSPGFMQHAEHGREDGSNKGSFATYKLAGEGPYLRLLTPNV